MHGFINCKFEPRWMQTIYYELMKLCIWIWIMSSLNCELCEKVLIHWNM